MGVWKDKVAVVCLFHGMQCFSVPVSLITANIGRVRMPHLRELSKDMNLYMTPDELESDKVCKWTSQIGTKEPQVMKID